MKKLTKFFSVVLVVLSILCCFNVTVFATETTQDGLSAIITSDKESYNSGEDIKLNLKVTNTNEYEVNNVSLEAFIPDELKLKNEQDTAKTVDKLGSGESISLDLVVVKDETPTGNTEITEPSNKNNNSNGKAVVNTGNTSSYVLIIIAIFVISLIIFVIAYKNRKKATQVISMLLCLCVLVGSIALVGIPKASADETGIENCFDVSKIITVNNKNYNLVANVKYKNNTNSSNINFDYLRNTPSSPKVGEHTNVTFSIDVSSDEIPIDGNLELYVDDKFVGELNDNGENGDISPNDQTYSGTFSMFSDERRWAEYYVVYKNQKVATETFLYYKTETPSETLIIEDFYKDIDDIMKKYTVTKSECIENENDALSKIKQCYNEITLYLDNRSDIEYEFTDTGFVVRFDFALTVGVPLNDLIISTNNDIVMSSRSINSKMVSNFTYKSKIATLQPHYYELNGTEFDNAATNIAKENNNYVFSENLDNQEVTFETMKDLSEYGIIILDSHGGNWPDYGYIISLSETVTEEKNEEYRASGDLYDTIVPNKGHYMITEKFFEKYYNNTDFDNSIIYLGTCHGGDDNVKIRRILENKGAEAILTYKNSVISKYNREMITTISKRLSKGDTVDEAVKKAKEKNGEHDPYISGDDYNNLSFWDKVRYLLGLIESKNPAELILTGNNTSVKLLTDTDTEIEDVTPSEDIEFKTMKRTGVYDNKLTYSLARPGEYIENSTVSFLPTSIRDKVGYYMIVDDYIYYIPVFSWSGGTVELRRMKLDGSSDELLANDVSLPYVEECKYYNNKLYYEALNDYNLQRTTINTVTLEKKTEEIPCSMEYYYNGLFYAVNGNKICAYNFETGTVQEICQGDHIACIDNNYSYYSKDNNIYSTVTLYRINLDTNETEKLKSQFSEDYIVNNGIVYYLPPAKAQMTGIIAYNIAENSASVLGDLYVAEGLQDLWFEEGVLFYTVSNGNKGNGSSSSYGASDYIFDFNTNQYVLISNYYIPSF